MSIKAQTQKLKSESKFWYLFIVFIYFFNEKSTYLYIYGSNIRIKIRKRQKKVYKTVAVVATVKCCKNSSTLYCWKIWSNDYRISANIIYRYISLYFSNSLKIFCFPDIVRAERWKKDDLLWKWFISFCNWLWISFTFL